VKRNCSEFKSSKSKKEVRGFYISSQNGKFSSSSSSLSVAVLVGLGACTVEAGAADGDGVGMPDGGAGGTWTALPTHKTYQATLNIARN
jgi:hypothetical protein